MANENNYLNVLIAFDDREMDGFEHAQVKIKAGMSIDKFLEEVNGVALLEYDVADKSICACLDSNVFEPGVNYYLLSRKDYAYNKMVLTETKRFG
jgi:hypothetical protein